MAMGSQDVDLVYELQVELNWDKRFASSACKEYYRWLQLRAKTGDFYRCKLPPSRAVAIVWNLHRQWTLDYEKMCTTLGGFIHHHPPAMRMSFSREQGYAVTLQTYKSHFKEDPPPAYWEPLICPSRRDVGPPDPAAQTMETFRDAQPAVNNATTEPSATETEDNLPKMDIGNARTRRSSGLPRSRRKGASSSRQSPRILKARGFDREDGGNSSNPSYRVVLDTVAEPISLAQGIVFSNNVDAIQGIDEHRNGISKVVNIKDVDQKESRLTRSHRGGKKVRQRCVLRPLAPGEKRRRGRPSLSEYIPVSELVNTKNGRESGLISEDNEEVEKDHVDQSMSRLKSASAPQRGRKGVSSKRQARMLAPRSSRQVSGNRSKSSRSVAQGELLRQRTRASGHGIGPKICKVRTSRQQMAGVRIGPDGSTLRRPRGRPRKDGSWPIPRAKRQSGFATTNQSRQPAIGKEDRYLSTTVVHDTNIEPGDVPAQTLESEVGSLEPTMPDSNETQIQCAI